VGHFIFWIKLSLRPNHSTLVSVPSSDYPITAAHISDITAQTIASSLISPYFFVYLWRQQLTDKKFSIANNFIKQKLMIILYYTTAHSDSNWFADSFWANRFVLLKKIGHSIRPLQSPNQWSYAHRPILRRCISHSTVQLILLTLLNIYWLVFVKLWEWLMMTV